jgi:esterase/lipase
MDSIVAGAMNAPARDSGFMAVTVHDNTVMGDTTEDMDIVSGSSKSASEGVWVSWKDFLKLESDHVQCQKYLARFANELENCRAELATTVAGVVRQHNSLANAAAAQQGCQDNMAGVSSTLAQIQIERRRKK